MAIDIPKKLASACRGSEERERWLGRLPSVVTELEARWSLEIGAFDHGTEGTASWVAPVRREDGSSAVLKIGLPHMEARDEAQGLDFWAGDSTVRLLDFAEEHFALLLERCVPGTPLRRRPESEQDAVVAGLLRRLWRAPPSPNGFRPLSSMTAFWASATAPRAAESSDPGLVREGLRLFEELSRPSTHDVLLATDLHAGNVLSAERLPWLVIDPKPFVGDPAYDATQHLLNCEARLRAEPRRTIERFADLLEVDSERVRSWLFARVAAEPGAPWASASCELAKLLSWS